MNILAVDTSGNVCTAAVLSGEKIISEIYVDNKKTHSQTLGLMIDDCLKRAGVTLDGIDLFGCSVGPGSFTGLRIGTGMIKAFCHASGKKCVAVNTLDALAANVQDEKRAVCPIIDARRTDVYTAVYENGKKITDYRAITIVELLSELEGNDVLFLGGGAVKFKKQIIASGFCTAHSGISLQRAGSVGRLAYINRDSAVSAYELEPFYLRQTQAERMYALKHGKAK